MKKYAYIGCLGFLGIITTEFGVIGILPQLAAHYGVPIERAGLLLSAFALVIALTGPFMSLLMARFDRKMVMSVALLIFFLSALFSFFSPPFWSLLLIRVLPAFMQPVYIATALSVAVAKADKSTENELMGIVFSGVAIAMVTTVPLATYLASIWGWQLSFILQALVSFIALCFVHFGLPAMPPREQRNPKSQLGILKRPTFIASVAMNFFMIAAWFSTYSYFAEYLSKAKAMSGSMIGYLFFVFGIVGVVANFLSGRMMNKSIARTTFLFLSGTLIVPMLLLGTGDTICWTVMVVGLWGFMYSPSFLNASTYMISAAPEAMEFANSLATSFGNLGVSLGTTIGGIVISVYGVQYLPYLTAFFGALAMIMMFIRYALERSGK